MNPFSELGLADTFEVDVKALEKTHRDLSRALHPDRYVQAPAGERRVALERAVRVNEAFRAVKDPLSRAEALFALRGTPIGDGKEPKPDPDFLMDVLESREALSDAKGEKNAAAVAKLKAAAEASHERVLAALGAVFAKPEKPDESAVKLLGKLRFFRRFLEEVSDVEDDLDAT